MSAVTMMISDEGAGTKVAILHQPEDPKDFGKRQIETSRAQLIAMILMYRCRDLCGMSKAELQAEYLREMKGG